jgi:hypothetical protein
VVALGLAVTGVVVAKVTNINIFGDLIIAAAGLLLVAWPAAAAQEQGWLTYEDHYYMEWQ